MNEIKVVRRKPEGTLQSVCTHARVHGAVREAGRARRHRRDNIDPVV